jgi:hypothetical protein
MARSRAPLALPEWQALYREAHSSANSLVQEPPPSAFQLANSFGEYHTAFLRCPSGWSDWANL